MVLVELYSRLEYVFEAVTRHSVRDVRGACSHDFKSSLGLIHVPPPSSETMANASAKRIGSITPSRRLVLLIPSLTASQNEAAIMNMLYGHLLGNLLPLLIRILFRWQAFRQSKTAIILYCGSAALSQFLYRHLKKMGTPRRDSTGNVLSPGDDLNQPGMTEWIFDILYISCES